jgi:uncharacterized membrane protein
MSLIRGFPGKPLHPPLTDASIGSYTLGVVALAAGKAGLETTEMSHAALIGISLGLVLAAPTAITGLADWLYLPRDTPARQIATIHMVLMLATTVVFALTWLLQRSGYQDGEIRTGALVAGLAAAALLVAGGNVGGANVFVYGIRVLGRPDTPPAKALNPFGVETDEPDTRLAEQPHRRP